MSRATRRKAVQRLVKSVIKSKEQDIQVQLPKGSFDYFTKLIKKHGS